MTAAELRARAGRRRGFGSLTMQTKALFGAGTSIAAVVAIAAIVSLNPRTPPEPGSSPSAPIASSSTRPSALPSVAPSPEPSLLPVALTRGAILTVATEETGNRTLIHVYSTVPGEAATIIWTDDPALQQIPNFDPDLDGFAISPLGMIALPLYDESAPEPTRAKTAVLALHGAPRDPVVVAGGQATFGPDGTLYTAEQTGPDFRTVIHRTTGLPFAAVTTDLLEPVDFSSGGTSGIRLLADASGVAGTITTQHEGQPDTSAASSLLWDGTVVGRDASVAILDDGRNVRTSGVFGETIGEACDSSPTGGSCVAMWYGPGDAQVRLDVADGVTIGNGAWTPDGRMAIFTSGSDVYTVAGPGHTVDTLGSLPREAGQVVAVSAEFLLIGDLTGVSRVAFDGTVDADVAQGRFLQIVP